MNFLEGKGFPLPDSMTEAQYEQILKYETKRGQTLYLDAIVEGQDQNDEALEKIMTEEKSLFQPLQVNFCQKHLFSYQLTHNMTKFCSLIYQFST